MRSEKTINRLTVALLKRARKLITDPQRWTRDTAARRRSGEMCMATGDRAFQWCALGAIEHEANPNLPGIALLARVNLADAVAGVAYAPTREIASFNDHHTHDEVLAMFDKAIRNLDSAGTQSA